MRRAWLAFVRWVNVDDPAGDIPDAVPEQCATCRQPRPVDRMRWERWEAEHERRHRDDAEAWDELLGRAW
jgi:hypothetical protein